MAVGYSEDNFPVLRGDPTVLERKILMTDEPTVIMLGNRVADIITNAEGIAIARSQHLYGCTHIHIKPTDLDEKGQIRDSNVVDLARCRFIEAAFGKPDGPPAEPALGKTVRDPITGFEGVVIVTMEHLYEPVQVCVEARYLREGQPIDQWFVGSRLVEVPETETIAEAPRGPGAAVTSEPKT
jgi:hypothetical protein